MRPGVGLLSTAVAGCYPCGCGEERGQSFEWKLQALGFLQAPLNGWAWDGMGVSVMAALAQSHSTDLSLGLMC